MKLVAMLVVAFALGSPAFGQEKFAHKKVPIQVETFDEVARLSETKNLDFGSWLNLVGNDAWTLMHASQSSSFYCAIFRDNDHIIMWLVDRKDLLKQTSFQVTSKDVKAKLKLNMRKYAVVERIINDSTGAGLNVVDNATVFEVKQKFDGWINIRIKGIDQKGKSREVLSLERPWNREK